MASGKKLEAKIRSLKAQGLDLSASGRYAEAALVYVELFGLEPTDGDWARRAADCYWQLKKDAERLNYCLKAAEAYAQAGHLLKAIAMSKVVLSLDPSRQETAEQLAQMYAKRTQTATTRLEPAPPLPLPRKKETKAEEPEAGQGDPAGDSPESRKAQKARARLAAAAALRAIRARREAADAMFASQFAEPKPSDSEKVSVAPLSLSLEQGAPAQPLWQGDVDASSDELGPHTERDVQAPSLPPHLLPSEPPPSLGRAPSLAAISLRTRLPSLSKRPEPGSAPEGIYSLMLSQVPPPTDVWADPTVSLQLPLPSLRGLEASLPTMQEPSHPPYAPPVTPLAPPQSDSQAEPALEGTFEKVPLFSDLAPPLLLSLIDAVALVELEVGQVLFQEGDIADAMYVVVDGLVAAEAVPDKDTVIEWAQLSDGEFFGEIGLLSDQPRQARVRALEPTRLLRIEREAIARLIESDETFLASLMSFFRSRLVADLMMVSPLFTPFDPDEQKRLVELFEFLEIEGDSVLLRPGEKSPGLYVLLTGEALQLRPGGPGGLRHLSPGAIFGERPLLLGTKAASEVRTVGKCFALFLPAAAFRQLIMTHPLVLEYISTLPEEPAGRTPVGEHVTLF